MKKYEYKTIYCPHPPHAEEMTKTLNKYGEEGWKVIREWEVRLITEADIKAPEIPTQCFRLMREYRDEKK